MQSTAPRAIRVARRPTESLSGAEAVAGGAVRPFVRNDHGRQRGVRLFLLFAGLLVAIFGTFAFLLTTGPAAASSASIIAILAVVAALFLLWAYTITAGRAPRGVRYLADGSLLIVSVLGSQRRSPPSRIVRVAYRYPPSMFNQGPVEMVELSEPGGGRRPYLVNAGTFEKTPPTAADAP